MSTVEREQTDASGVRDPEDAERPAGPDAVQRRIESEALAHALLRLVGDLPGQSGRLRVARVVGGFPVIDSDGTPRADLEHYGVGVLWPLKQIVELVDALIAGRLLVQTIGARPTLVLTRAGHRALDALERGD